MKRMVTAAIMMIAFSYANGQQKSGEKMETKTEKQFSMLVRVPTTYGQEQVKAAGLEWDKLLERWKKQGIYVISFAFPGDSYVVEGEEKVIRHESVVSNNLRVVSNIVLRTSSIEEACVLAKEFPILKYGGSVEIRELPKPINTP
jgi:hypothetical protein